MGEEVYRIEDEVGLIVVTQRGEKRVLSFAGGLEQSSVLMNKPYCLPHEYMQIMLLGLVYVDARHITLLGLGGGGIAHFLSHYYPQVATQVVELRQSVIDVAYDWFKLPRTPSLMVECADAYQYMQAAEKVGTNLILSDLYEAQGMSEVQAQESFIDACYQGLAEQGLLVLNFHHLPEKNSPLMQKIMAMFAEVYICDVFSGNRVMFCAKNDVLLDKTELAARAKTLTKKVEMPLMYYFKQLRKYS